MSEARTLQLSANLDSQAAANLLTSILSYRGFNLKLDARDVRRLGGQCLQILIAAQIAWLADGQDLIFDPVSSEFSACLSSFGATSHLTTLIEPTNEG